MYSFGTKIEQDHETNKVEQKPKTHTVCAFESRVYEANETKKVIYRDRSALVLHCKQLSTESERERDILETHARRVNFTRARLKLLLIIDIVI